MESLTLIATLSILALMAVIFLGGIFMPLTKKVNEIDKAFNQTLEEEQENNLDRKMKIDSRIDIINSDGSKTALYLYKGTNSERRKELKRMYEIEYELKLKLSEKDKALKKRILDEQFASFELEYLANILFKVVENKKDMGEVDLNTLLYVYLERFGEENYDLLIKKVEDCYKNN